MLVSLGPPPAAYVMPDVTGLTAYQAQSKLGAAGLKLSILLPLRFLELRPGTVIGQSPQARTEWTDASTAGKRLMLQVESAAASESEAPRFSTSDGCVRRRLTGPLSYGTFQTAWHIQFDMLNSVL